MEQVSIPATDFEEITTEDSELLELLTADFISHPNHYRPECVNRSTVRKDKSQPLFQLRNNKLYGNGYVGVFRTQLPRNHPKYDLTIRFGSRFDTGDKHYFLLALLHSWVGNSGNSVDFDDQIIHASWDELFDFMSVAVFRQQLMDAYASGCYRSYQYFKDNSDRLRGSIDISRHTRLNLGMRNGKIAMRYRENTPDNPMNHLILHTYHELKQHHPALVGALIECDESKTVLDSLRYLAPSYRSTYPAAVATKLLQPISNPLYEAYERLRCTCLRILGEEGVPVFEQGEEQEKNILFYSPDLWENFIDCQILTKLRDIDPNAQHEEKYYGDRFSIRPDFVLSNDSKRIVLDAKYKKIWGIFANEPFAKLEDYQKKALEADIKQCLLYYTILQASYTGVIIPVVNHIHIEESKRKVKLSQWDPKKDGSFRIFDVEIPQSSIGSYQDWRKALTENEEETAQRIDALCAEIGVCSREGKQ